MTVQQAHRIEGRSLVPTELFDRLSARIVADHGFDPELSERIVDQALAFLKACADNQGTPLSPSWLIHHVPTDEPGGTTTDHTIEAIRCTGFAVDETLWEGAISAKCDTDKCHGCASGCHDEPPPIPPYRAA